MVSLVASLFVVAAPLVMIYTPTGDSDNSYPSTRLPSAEYSSKIPAALWVGDSFTAGFGSDRRNPSYPIVVSQRLGWVACLDAQGGTGYLNPGKKNSPNFTPFKGRLASDIRTFRPDLVVIDGGRNDRWAKRDDLFAAARAYINSARRAWPQARIIVVLPTFLSRGLNVDAKDARDAIRSAALAEHVQSIDPLAWGLSGRTDEPGLVSPDGVHPSNRGQVLYSDVLTDALREFS